MVNRLSDTPAKIIVGNVAAYLFIGFMVWRTDRDEGVTTSTVVMWVVLAVMCIVATCWHIQRLKKALDQRPVRRPDPLRP